MLFLFKSAGSILLSRMENLAARVVEFKNLMDYATHGVQDMYKTDAAFRRGCTLFETNFVDEFGNNDEVCEASGVTCYIILYMQIICINCVL